MPNERPSRDAGTYRASVRLDDSWPRTLHHALHSRMTTRLGYERANAATAVMTAAAPSTATRLVGPEPKRSTSQPHGSDASALTPKNSATTSPRPAGSNPISAEICTASPPARNTGSTDTVVVVTAPIAARTAPGGTPSSTPAR